MNQNQKVEISLVLRDYYKGSSKSLTHSDFSKSLKFRDCLFSVIRVVCYFGSDRKQPCLQTSLFKIPYFVFWFLPYISLPLSSLLSIPSPFSSIFTVKGQLAVAVSGWCLRVNEVGCGTLFTVAPSIHTRLAVLGKPQRRTCQTSDVVEKEENGMAFSVAHCDLVTVCLEMLCPAVC